MPVIENSLSKEGVKVDYNEKILLKFRASTQIQSPKLLKDEAHIVRPNWVSCVLPH